MVIELKENGGSARRYAPSNSGREQYSMLSTTQR